MTNQTQAKNQIETLVAFGQITATSKKNEGDFSQEIPTKTAYIKTDEVNAKRLEDFGLTKYTSKSNNEDYFIIKFPANVMVYQGKEGTKRPDLSQIEVNGMETNNFKTTDGKLIPLNILKGNHKNNDFYRLQAIMIENESDIEEIKPENPFADLLTDDGLPF